MDEVLYEKYGAIATITLNRPERLNAISASHARRSSRSASSKRTATATCARSS